MEIPEQLRQRLANVTNLPSPSDVAMKIIELARDPDINLSAVATLVNRDPALASKIMRTANSALFAQRRRSDNLRKALIVLGLNATLTLALSFSLAGVMRKQEVAGIDLPAYWRRCLLGATAARVTGEVLGRTDTEDLFLAGLLQDIGILAIDKCETGFYADLGGQDFDHASIAAYEMTNIGADHAAVGAWLLEQWNMPPRLVAAVAASHAPGPVADSSDSGFQACVAVSGPIADLVMNPGDNARALAAAELFVAHTGSEPNRLGTLLVTLREQIPDIESLYESDLVDAGHAEQILDQAREILMLRNLQALQQASAMELRAREAEERSRRDGLTGVFNRAHMRRILEREFEAARSNGWPLSIAFIDMDSFKQINDTHGHLAGDRMLVSTARVLTETLRDSDIVTRYGGDEFVIIMPGSDSDMARAAARRVTERYRDTRHDIGERRGLNASLSIGVASLDNTRRFEHCNDLLEAADTAVYVVKERGRNGFAVFNDLERDHALPENPARIEHPPVEAGTEA